MARATVYPTVRVTIIIFLYVFKYINFSNDISVMPTNLEWFSKMSSESFTQMELIPYITFMCRIKNGLVLSRILILKMLSV